MQSRRSGEPRSAFSRASFDDRERLIFPSDDVEANAGFSLSDLTEDSEDDEMRMQSGVSGVGGKKKKVVRNGAGNGLVNGNGRNGLVRGPVGSGALEYREVAQKENSQPPLR